MKTIFTTAIALFCILTNVHGQKIRKAQARQILETAINCLKTSDSLSFVKLWYFDCRPAPGHDHPFTERSVMLYFHYLREFVDTALIRNLKIEEIEISKVSQEQRESGFGRYNIKVWFKYTDKYFKGFGFFVDYINNKWVVRDIPDTSTLSRN
jgi:hypothetical protein